MDKIVNQFRNFIAANIEDIDIFDEEFLRVCSKPNQDSAQKYAEYVAFKYSYNFDKFIDSVTLFLEIEDDAGPMDYVNSQYLKSIH